MGFRERCLRVLGCHYVLVTPGQLLILDGNGVLFEGI